MPLFRNGFLLVLTLAVVVAVATGCAAARQDAPAARDPGSLAAARDLATPATTRDPAVPVSVGPPGPGDWATWPHAQKLAYMKSTFIVEERKLFASWEPSRYLNLECQDCHGSGVRDGTFRMPNPDLPKLAPGPEGFKDLAEKEPQVLAFMQKRVVPETARLLGVPDFDFKTHSGFSCYHCHLRKPSASGK